MATINIVTVSNLLIVTVLGSLTADEVIAVVNEYYSNGIVKDVIWDLSNGSLHSISHEGFKTIAKAAKEAVACGARQNGKTVFIGDSDLKFGLLSIYSAITEITEVPIKYDVIKTLDEARDWIDGIESKL